MDRVTCRESCKRHMAVGGKVRRGKRGFSAMANDICTCKCTTIRLWRSFAVSEQLKPALVLVFVVVVVVLLLVLLLLVLVLVLVVVVVVVVVVLVVVVVVVVVVVAAAAAAAVVFCCSCSTSDFRIFVAPKTCQMGGVFVFFYTFGAKNTVNICKYQCFWRTGSPKPRYLRHGLLLVEKMTLFTMFLGKAAEVSETALLPP